MTDRIEWAIRNAVAAKLRRGQRDDIAGKFGHDGPWFSKWRHGRISLPVDDLARMCELVGLDLPTVIARALRPASDEILAPGVSVSHRPGRITVRAKLRA